MAEGLFRQLVQGRSDYEVASAGVSAYDGDFMNQHSETILREAGIDTGNFRSQKLTPELLAGATHIFAMAGSHLQALESLFPEAANKAYLISEFSPDDAIRGRDVSDPFGADFSAYKKTRDLINQLLPTILSYIDQTFDPST